MNEPAAPFDAPPDRADELEAEVQSLRLLLCISLILVMVFGLCMDYYLYKQTSDLRTATRKAQPLWNAVDVTKAVYFWNALTDYQKTHPDLKPLMTAAGQFTDQTLLNPAYTPKKK